MAESLATETTSLQDNLDARTKIINLYSKELAKEGSALNVAIKKIEEEEGFPELGSLDDMQKKDLFLTSTGRGGINSAYQSYLVGIRASRKGSGLVQENVAYIEASVFMSLDDETETVTLNKFVVIADK